MKFMRVEERRTIEHEAREHEVFLEFWDDAGACAFSEWLGAAGWESFAKWCAGNPDYSSLVEEEEPRPVRKTRYLKWIKPPFAAGPNMASLITGEDDVCYFYTGFDGTREKAFKALAGHNFTVEEV